MARTWEVVRPSTGASGETMTAMPSRAMTVATAPFSTSESLISREAMPMLQVPSMAMETPVEESDCWTSTVTSALRAL